MMNEHIERWMEDVRRKGEEMRQSTEKAAIREAAIRAVHHLEAQHADPSVEQYVDAVMSVIPPE